MAKQKQPNWPNELRRPEAVLGLIALAVQPWLISLRADEFAHALTLTTPRATGTCAALGLALTLAQAIGASIFIMESPASKRSRYLKALSAAAWLLATALDLFLSVICAHGVTAQSISLAVTALLALCETYAGILVIDAFIVPAAMSLAWAVTKKTSNPLSDLARKSIQLRPPPCNTATEVNHNAATQRNRNP